MNKYKVAIEEHLNYIEQLENSIKAWQIAFKTVSDDNDKLRQRLLSSISTYDMIGHVNSHGNVIWFKENPHSFPKCTEFYAVVNQT